MIARNYGVVPNHIHKLSDTQAAVEGRERLAVEGIAGIENQRFIHALGIGINERFHSRVSKSRKRSVIIH